MGLARLAPLLAGVDPYPGAVVALDFGAGRFKTQSGRGSTAETLPSIAYSRGSPATRINVNGLDESVPPGAIRASYDRIRHTPLGALLEPQIQNGIRNATFAGLVAGTVGSGGSLPTNFQTGSSISGIAVDVAAATVRGQPGMTVRLHGTAGSTGAFLVQFESPLGLTVAVSDTWLVQADLAMTGGSVTNIDSMALGYVERNSGGTFQNTKVCQTINRALLSTYPQRLFGAKAVTAGVRIAPYISVNVTSGNAIDITLTIGNVLAIKDTRPTTPIYSNGAAATRSADALSVSLPTGSSAYLITAEPFAYSDGTTLAHLVDGSTNALRLYRSGQILYAVTAPLGVEGTPVALGKWMVGQPGQIAITVSGGTVAASYNGKPTVALTDGAAYTTAYLGQKGDTSNQWGGTVKLFVVDPSPVLRPTALTDMFDDFDRGNGAIGTSPSGFTWVQIAALSQIVLATISSSALIAADSGQATTAAYNGIDMGAGANIEEMRSVISYGSGTANNGSVTLIANPNGLTTVANITDKSIHISFTDTKVDVSVWLATSITIIATITYASVLAHDGTLYAIGWELDGNTIRVTLPDGTLAVVTDDRFLTYGGRYGTFEHFWTGSGAARPTINAAYARA